MTIAEFWKERYGVVVAEKKALGDKLRETLDENKELKKKVESLEASLTYEVLKGAWDRIEELKKELEEKTERLDKSIADRSELQADRDIWFRKNGEKQAKIEELKKELEEIKQEFKQSYADGYSDGNEEGQNELWEMLQLINDVKPFEAPYFEDVTSMNDIISWDLEDFKEAYDKWEAEKKKAAEEAKKQHVEYMRDYLKRYCRGRLCINCPLHYAFKSVSSCLFSKLTEEELEKRYKKVIESDDKKMPRYFTSTIEAVFTAEAKLNKDLLKDICGVKPEEGAHKLEYGDAVRLHWRDYDYMYIGPDEKEGALVRLFDPKNHAIVTTHIANVRYNGGKIILTNEDDLRMIWQDKK